jgi:thioredoxin reductase (NADPH)
MPELSDDPALRPSVLIVGAGPIGLACAISAKRRGIDPLVIDAGAIANSILHYPVGMTFFTTPERLEIGNHPITTSREKPTREEALKYYRGVARAEGLRVRTYTRLTGVRRGKDGLVAELQSGIGEVREREVGCERLVLATGYFDQPNRLNVAGEDLPHVSHYPEEPHRAVGLDVVVVGGKNSAVEMALSAHRAGARVTLVCRGTTLKPSVKYWLRPDIENRIKAGEIGVRWSTTVCAITPDHVVVQQAGKEAESLPADLVYLLTGYAPDFGLFQRIGLELDRDTGRPFHNPETLESNVPGIYLAGSVTAGRFISEVFIENGRYDGEKIFGDAASRRLAAEKFAKIERPIGE